MTPNIFFRPVLTLAVSAFLLASALPSRAVSPTTTVLTMTSGGHAVSTLPAGNAVALIATVKSGSSSVMVGQVNFCNAAAVYCTDFNLLGTAQITAAGTARVAVTPGIGQRLYKAVFLPTKSYVSSTSATVALTVTGKRATDTTFTQTGSSGNFTLSAVVAGHIAGPGSVAPTGTVDFLDATNGNTLLGSGTLHGATDHLGWTMTPTFAGKAGGAPVLVADFNGDGRPDLVLPDGNSCSPRLLIGHSDGTFTPATAGIPFGACDQSIIAGDFNSDGKTDLIGIAPGLASISFGVGDGTFTSGAALPVSSYGSLRAATADFNHDGIADLAITFSPGYVQIYLGQGDGKFKPQPSVPTSGEPFVPVVGDFNNDGFPDVIVSNFNGTVDVFLGNGDGTLTPGPRPDAAVGWYMIAADVNLDGNLDLLAANFDQTAVVLYTGNGDGTFNSGQKLVDLGYAFGFSIGDFNGDGIPDLVVPDDGKGAVIVLIGKGDGTFTNFASIPIGAYAYNVSTGDFNGDGLSDFFVPVDYLSYPDTEPLVFITQLTNSATATETGIAINAAAPHQVVASYTGDDVYAPSVSPFALVPSAVASLSAASLTFTNQLIDTASPPQAITVTNTGDGPLTISRVWIYGPSPLQYSVTNTCAAPVAAGAFCTINVTYKPTGISENKATLKIAANIVGSPLLVPLIGSYIAPLVVLRPGSFDFGNQRINVQSVPVTITATNYGAAPLKIGSIRVTGNDAASFVAPNDCGSSLAINASCSITASFYPKAAGPASAAITFTDNDPSVTQNVPLAGIGVYPPVISIKPASINFGSVIDSDSTPDTTVTIANTGKGPLTITGQSLTGINSDQFFFYSYCSTPLPAGASCSLFVRFSPTAVGPQSAALTFKDDAPGSPQSVILSGIGVAQPTIALSADSLDFGQQEVGTQSAAKIVYLTNTSSTPMPITQIVLTIDDTAAFLISNDCGTTLAPHATCAIRVRFHPNRSSIELSYVGIYGDFVYAPQYIFVSGQGFTPPTAMISTTAIDFGTQPVNTQSSARTVTLTNNGSLPLNLTNIALGGAHPGQYLTSNNCGATVAPLASCNINVRFYPRIPGSLTAALTITDNAANSPQSISLSGTGQ